MRRYSMLLLVIGLSLSACNDPGGPGDPRGPGDPGGAGVPDPPSDPTPTSRVHITVTTTGQNIDSDGYRVVADDSDQGTISANGTTVIRLQPGSRTIALRGLTPNCEGRPRSRVVTVVAGRVVTIGFVVQCSATLPPPLPTSGVLAFTTRENNLALVNLDGTNYQALTPIASDQQHDWQVAWSPSGDRIAFSRETEGSAAFSLAIHLVNPDGTNLLRLSPSQALDYGPAWSPDGRRIAFTNITPGFDSAAAWQIYLMNADGSHRLPLTNLSRGADSPTWSPDGRRIAFMAGGTAVNNYNIYVMDADGTHLSALTNDPGWNFDPSWSPDGSRIVFGRDRALFVINTDGTHRMRLTSPSPTRWSYSDSEPAWSPDGQWVVFTRRYDCDSFGDSDGPPCSPSEVRAIQLIGVPSVSAFVTEGWGPSWRP